MRVVFHPAALRGAASYGWLQSRFSFSFADWHDPERMGFGALRVINDDVIAPHSGFELHAHRDMEIVTIVMEGAVTHEDSMGNAEKIRAGEVQAMTAGTGVAHSEYNHEPVPLQLFQIWILPRARGLRPRYMQWRFAPPVPGVLQMLVSPHGEGESLMINQDAFIHRVTLEKGASATHAIPMSASGAYVLVISGDAEVAGQTLGPRDAVGVWDTERFDIIARTDADLLLVTVPMQ